MTLQRVNPPPVGECKRCGKRAKSTLLAFTICYDCYIKESKADCGKCGREKRFVTENGGFCLKCSERASSAIEIECRECGKIRPPAKRGSEYCDPCRQRVTRRGICSKCGRRCRYWSKIKELCKRCGSNDSAARRLKRFVEALEISDDYNRFLFEKVVATINWEAVHEEVRRRIVETGTFLQNHEIEEPLSWGTIRDLISELSGSQYRVRECLEQLAEHLLGPDADEPNRPDVRVLALINSLPTDLRPLARRYDDWLLNERKNTYTVTRNHFLTLRKFWRYGVKRGVTCLSAVRSEHVDEFLYILSFKWECRECSSTRNVSARGEVAPNVCENSACATTGGFDKVARCLPAAISAHRARLRIFFGWLKDVERGIDVNPAPPAEKKKKKRHCNAGTNKKLRTIQYYDWEIIDSLFNAIETNAIEGASMPVAEAFALSFVLHHGFYVHELQTVRIPLECRPLVVGGASPEPLERVLRLEWLPRELSRNRHFVGRTGDVFEMQPADEPWLRELTARFMRDRSVTLRDLNNPYLFVCKYSRHPCQPVGKHYIWRLIQKATARITGRVCNPNILAKSSRLLYSEFGGYEGWRHLRELGLCETHARRYAWAQRIRVIPKEPGEEAIRRFSAGLSPLVLPPNDIFGKPTALRT